jgi:fatty-acyl-CoA synthase
MTRIGDYVRIGAESVPTRTALVDVARSRSWTYAQLADGTEMLAAALHGLGMRRGQRLACWLRTSAEYVQMYLAAVRVGVVIIPVNERLSPEEVRYQLTDSDPHWLAYHASFAPLAERAGILGQLPSICVGGPVRRGDVDFGRILSHASDPAPDEVVKEDPVLLGYTSGTTGFPKGAVLTHQGVASVNRTNAVAYRLPMGSRGVYAGSMSFTASVPAFMLTHFWLAGTVILSPSNDPDEVLDVLAREGGTYTAVAPPNVGAMADACERAPGRLSSLRSMLQGAGAARLDDVVRLNSALGGRLVTGWGMTENSGGLATALSPTDSMRALAGEEHLLATVGHPLPGFHVRIDEVAPEDDGGDAPEEDGTGELVIRAPSIMEGYWRQPEAIDRSLTSGWYRTGDLGHRDAQGRIVIADRRSDLIVSGGMNVYPSEVERVIQGVAGVRECAVVGVPHARWGRAVAAVVVADESVTSKDVLDQCKASLAGYKKPLSVAFVEQLPRTIAGKVPRASLARSLQAGRLGTERV